MRSTALLAELAPFAPARSTSQPPLLVRRLARGMPDGENLDRLLVHAMERPVRKVVDRDDARVRTLGDFGRARRGNWRTRFSIASTLLLAPGVPATNAQTDIVEGFPTVGSARAVSVAMIMVFATIGIWGAEAVLGMLP